MRCWPCRSWPVRAPTGRSRSRRRVAGKATNVNSTAALHKAQLAGRAGCRHQPRHPQHLAGHPLRHGDGARHAAGGAGRSLGIRPRDARVNYTDVGGNPVQLDKVKQGTDLAVDIELRNTTRAGHPQHRADADRAFGLGDRQRAHGRRRRCARASAMPAAQWPGFPQPAQGAHRLRGHPRRPRAAVLQPGGRQHHPLPARA